MKQTRHPGCPPIEELNEARWQAHVAGCPFCEMDLKMLLEFEQAMPTTAEQADVAAIVDDLRQRRTPATEPKQSWRGWFTMPMLPRLVGGLAALVLVAAIGLQWQGRRDLEYPIASGSGVVRSAVEIALEPQGDLSALPDELRWTAVPGATRYRLIATEVDGTPLTQLEVNDPKAPLPDALRTVMLPMKTVLLEIQAVDGTGKVVAKATGLRLKLDKK